MRLNGWQRLWVVFLVPWVILLVILVGEDAGSGDALYYAVIAILPPIAVYIFGMGIAWAIRGFKK